MQLKTHYSLMKINYFVNMDLKICQNASNFFCKNGKSEFVEILKTPLYQSHIIKGLFCRMDVVDEFHKEQRTQILLL